MSDPKIDPNQLAEAVKNIKNDAERISGQLNGWCGKPKPPSRGIADNLNNTISGVNEVLPTLAPVDEENPNPVHLRIRATWKDLKDAWEDTYLMNKWAKEWNGGQIWKDCAEKAKIFSAVVFALQ